MSREEEGRIFAQMEDKRTTEPKRSSKRSSMLEQNRTRRLES
jgi:hypothetical protein